MALNIYTNNYSLIAQNNLTTANSSLAKSIERLSSGLRINHASDDASGLAISEKLRGQIRGFAKASMNAQDAISFLQTAEGGMEVIGDMLQRMRELAVQAGNGTYTSNDRSELQKEVNQLKDEINRIASSTEYNTKKLLTGDAAALWSTDNPKAMEAIVRGTPAEGNYKLSIDATGGQNYVYKTHEMTINKGSGNTYNATFQSVIGADAATTSIVSSARFVSDAKFDPFKVTVSKAATTAGANIVAQGPNTVINGQITVANVTSTGYLLLEANKDANLASDADLSTKLTASFYDAVTGKKTIVKIEDTGNAGEIKIDGVGTFTMSGTTGLKNADVGAGDRLLVGVTQASTAPTGSSATVKIGNGPSVVTDSGSVAVIDLDEQGNIIKGTLNYSIGSGTKATDVYIAQGKQNASKSTIITTQTLGIKSGGTAQFSVSGISVSKGAALTDNEKKVNVVDAGATTLAAAAFAGAATKTGFYVIEVLADGTGTAYQNINNYAITYIDQNGNKSTVTAEMKETSGTYTVEFDGIKMTVTDAVVTGKALIGATDNGMTISTTEAKVSTKGADKGPVYVTSGGKISYVDITLGSAGEILENKISFEIEKVPAAPITVNFDTKIMNGGIEDVEGKVAKLNSKLKDIDRFTNSDGRNILDNTQSLTVFGNGKTYTMTVEGNDTIEDFVNKLNKALISIGMSTGDSYEDGKLVKYITEEDAIANSNYALAGTIVYQGGIVGDNSKISFIGDENLIKGLGISTLQSGQNSDLSVTVTDAHNGNFIGSDKVSDNILRGVIKGVDVRFTGAAMNATIDAKGKATFTGSVGEMHLHIVDNRTEVQIGANEGQKFDVSIGAMNTIALEIDDAYIMTMDDSQKAITKFDQALEKVSSARASIGAQINRLEYTMRNLSVSKQNLVAAESRIRDLDVAEESATFSRNQILVNSAVAMLAQANQLPQIALQLIGR